MSKKTIHIVMALLAVLIIVEGFFIVKNLTADTSEPEKPLGYISRSQSSVNISGIMLPAYSYNSEEHIAAEDLHNFSFDVITHDNNSVSITHNIDRSYDAIETEGARKLSDIADNTEIKPVNSASFDGRSIPCYIADEYHIIPITALGAFADIEKSGNEIRVLFHSSTTAPSDGAVVNAASAQGAESGQSKRDVDLASASAQTSETTQASSGKKIIVLDPGHGLSSSSMSADEKTAAGYVYNSSKGQWGEWRHWKSGSSTTDCESSGCTGTHPANASCWYAMGNGDRSTEPEINLANSLAAKKYLEQMGYTVRMTRTTNNENPSFSKRLSYCYPNNDSSTAADAAVCVVIHSNAGGGRGSAYISAGGKYDQKGISENYASQCNALGAAINRRITSQTSLSQYSSGSIGGEEALIAFCKSPVPVGYIEIGFFDSSSDLSILKSESDQIGKSIAEGINDYLTQ